MILPLLLSLAATVGQDVRASSDSGDLQPTTYRSPSGEWELFVDPSAPDGAGEAAYTLSSGGELRCKGELLSTFWDAVVTDEGTCIGFGYSDGADTWSGKLVIARLDPTGKQKILESRLRGPSRFPDYAAVPSGIDVFAHPDLGQVVVVIGDRETAQRGLEWRFFDIESGHLRRAIRPKELQRDTDSVGDYLGAVPVPRTPLVLVHWAGNFGEDPVRFSLIDERGRSVWMLDRVEDTDGLRNEARRVGSHGLILGVGPSTFDLWSRSEGTRIRYGIEDNAGVWSVYEIEREPIAAQEPPPTDSGPVFEELIPVHLGSIDVSVPDPSLPAVQDVGPFTVDDKGHLAFLPADQRHPPRALSVVDADGQVVALHDLDAIAPATGTWVDVDWDRSARRFVLLFRGEEGGELWTLDPASGEGARLPVEVPEACAGVETLREGGFLLRHAGTVTCFDGGGGVRWETGGRAMAEPDRGLVAVLGLDGASIHLLDGSGVQVGRIDLGIVRRGRLGEGTALASDVDRGLLFVDSGRRVARLRTDGSVSSVFQLAYENGRAFRVNEGVEVGPQDRLWTTDRNTLLRLDASGVVDRRLGGGPGEEARDSETVAVGPTGRIYAVDRERSVVRVLDPLGKHLFNCDPSVLQTQSDASLQGVTLTVETDGSALLSGRNGVFLFSPEGRLTRIEERSFDPIRETRYALPEKGQRLVVGQRRAYLVDAKREVKKVVDRRPDGHWLRNLYQASVAPDGSFALLTGAQTRESGAGEHPGIHVYSPAGQPIRTLWIPVESETLPYIAYDGEHAVYVDECNAFLFDADGRPLGRFGLPGEPGIDHWQPLLPQHTEELWAFDGQHTIERYELP